MTDNLYYVSNIAVSLAILNRDEIADIDRKIEGRPDNYMGAFYRWLYDLDLDTDFVDRIGEIDGNEDGGKIGYNMPENWRHLMLDQLACVPTIDEVEIFLGELGIRKAFKLADECGYYEEEDYKEALTTDGGLRRLFYAVLDALILTNDELDEIEIGQYREWFDDDEEDEEDEDAIVPITDEEFEKIGGAVAQVA